MAKKPVLLCIMDGFGWVPEQTFGNAIAAAKKPNLDRLFETYPYTTIQASGMAVGLPEGQMGNSEVGHTNMGAGRIVYQQLTLITKSIMDGTMKENDVLVRNMRAAIDAGKAVHLMGLLGTGGVHSHIDHLFGLLLGHRHFQLHLRQEVDHVFGAAIEFGMAFLPAETLHLGDGDAGDPGFGQRFAHVVQLERLDDGHDHFHAGSSRECWVQDNAPRWTAVAATGLVAVQWPPRRPDFSDSAAQRSPMARPPARLASSMHCRRPDMIDLNHIDDLARRLSQLVPPGLRDSQEEVQQTFKAALQAGLAKLDLVTREEFDVQQAVLLRTREKLEALERTVATLEAQLADKPAQS